MVFLIHIDKPYAHFAHYLGTADDTDPSVPENPFTKIPWLMERLSSAGSDYRVVRTWPGRGQDWERRLRANGGGHSTLRSYCPDCRGEAALRRGVSELRPTKYPGPDGVYLRLNEQNAICLECPLRDCVGINNARCPIRIEQSRRKRDYDKRRRTAARSARKESSAQQSTFNERTTCQPTP